MNERWRRLNANTSQTQHVPLRANIASHQLCRERQPLWKSYDGLNLTCSDQCHGVRFHGTSTLQVCQGKPSHRNRKGRDSRLDISVFLRLHKQRPKIRPRPAQWLLQLLSQWMKGGEGWMPTRPKPNMCQTAFLEELWWPECNLSGSMPWCPFPWHKHLPRLALKNCYPPEV